MLTALAFSCSSDLDNPEAGSELDSVTVKTIVNTSELSAFADTILTDIFQSGVSGKSAKTNDCYTSETDGLVTTITFTDCVVENSELVNGTISATYFVDGNTGNIEAQNEREGFSDHMELDFSAYPNPFTDLLQVNTTATYEEDAIIEVYNSNLQLVVQTRLKAGANLSSIDLGNQANGLYLVRIKLPQFEKDQTLRVLKIK